MSLAHVTPNRMTANFFRTYRPAVLSGLGARCNAEANSMLYLYQGSTSVCSVKVRPVLVEKRLDFDEKLSISNAATGIGRITPSSIQTR